MFVLLFHADGIDHFLLRTEHRHTALAKQGMIELFMRQMSVPEVQKPDSAAYRVEHNGVVIATRKYSGAGSRSWRMQKAD